MTSSRTLVRAGGLALAVVSVLAYHAVGAEYYNGFWIPQGYGMDYVLVQELAHGALFVLFGLVAVAGFALALDGLSLAEGDLDRARRLTEPGRGVVLVALLAVLGVTWAIARYTLGYAAVLDDEHTYRFIAETLRTGSLTAPSPGTDLDFFREQFVVLTDTARYGKYPIGYPLLLALGQLLGVERLVGPALTALVTVPLFSFGTAVAGRPTAALAVVLFALSPQVLLTGATLLSQPASALCLVTGLACLLAAEHGRRQDAWLAAAGLAFGYGVLVRPLPGVLFVLVAAAYVALTPRADGADSGPALRRWAAFGAPLALCAGIILLVNWLQTGGALKTGYELSDAAGQGPEALIGQGDLGVYAMSIASHLFRLNLWLFGWPVSLVFCVFARRTRRVFLVWGMIGAAWAYRLLAPKAGVAATGPLYLFETVPLFCLLTADGLGQLVTAGRLGRPRLISARRALAIGLAATLVSLSMFLPVKLANLRRMAEAQLVLPHLLVAQGIHHALVFHHWAVPGPLALSWAYFPRLNSPRLDDDVLLVRYLGSPRDAARNLGFWRRRFPDRSAWYFGYRGRTPALVPLEEFTRGDQASSP